MKRLFKKPLFFFLFLLLQGLQARANATPSSCQSTLLEAPSAAFKPHTIELDFESSEAAKLTTANAEKIMEQISNRGRRFAPNSRLRKEFQNAMEDLTNDNYYYITHRKEVDPDWAQKRNEFYGKNQTPQYDSPRYSFAGVYGDPKAPFDYEQFVSPGMRYHSMLHIAYMAIRTSFSTKKELSVLDVGSGVGDTINAIKFFYPKARVTAFDKSLYMLAHVATTFKNSPVPISTRGGDFEQPLDFKDESFDVVTALYSANQYMHIDQFMDFMQETYRILKPGGTAVVEYGPWNAQEFTVRTVPLFLEKMRSIGFKTEEIPQLKIVKKPGDSTFYTILLFKPKVAKRRKSR